MNALNKLKVLFKALRAGYIRLEDIYAYLCIDKNKNALKLLKDQLILVLKEIIPKKGSGYIKFGSGDPYNTGRIMEAAALMYPYYQSFTEVIPVFDEACLEVKQKAEGGIRLIVPLIAALKIFKSQELRAVYKKLTKEVEGFKADFSETVDISAAQKK